MRTLVLVFVLFMFIGSVATVPPSSVEAQDSPQWQFLDTDTEFVGTAPELLTLLQGFGLQNVSFTVQALDQYVSIWIPGGTYLVGNLVSTCGVEGATTLCNVYSLQMTHVLTWLYANNVGICEWGQCAKWAIMYPGENRGLHLYAQGAYLQPLIISNGIDYAPITCAASTYYRGEISLIDGTCEGGPIIAFRWQARYIVNVHYQAMELEDWNGLQAALIFLAEVS